MASFPTAEDFREAARAALLTPGSPLSADVVDLPTSNAGLVVEAASTIGVLLARQAQDAFAGLLLGSARGEALDLLVRDRYEIVRLGASPGFGEVSLTRPTAAFGAITLPVGTKMVAGAIELELMESASFGPAALGPVVADAKTTKGGADQTMLSGTSLQLQGVADTSIVGVLSGDLAGADDEESDDELVIRARNFWTNARRGTLEAIRNGLLTTPGVYRATVQEVTLLTGELAGHVEAWISDKAGRSNTTLVAQAEALLDEYRPAGVQVIVYAVTPVYVDIEVDVAFGAGVDTSAKRDEIRNLLVAKVNSLGPGESLRLPALYGVLAGVADIVTSDGAFSEPVGDLVAASGECIRTRADLVLVNGG
jgi:hypothetical protein